ncbi:MAG: TrkH family potassium uptake protein [Bacillota bacterium]|nr:TrkH family potassium uptake protein [Bacillota bacterium]
MTSETRRVSVLTPPRVLAIGFALIILTGAALLSLPLAAADGRPLPFLDALFTATSATCVTGLVVVDTGTRFSTFGQLVILALIQIGGLGFMAVATIIMVLLGRRITLRERLLIREAFNQVSLAGMVALVKAVILLTLAIELSGAFLLSLDFVPRFGWGRGLYYSLFHAVSAFNNAGFDLMGGFRSLTAFVANPLVSLTIAGLLIIGGLGFSVLIEVLHLRSFRCLSLHAKLVLITTALLLLTGLVAVLTLEWGNPRTLGPLPFGVRLLASFFQAATPRTAGFNTLEIGSLRPATLLVLIVLMFIGASPGSTGGGVKTTTVGTLVATVWATVRGQEEIGFFQRRIPVESVLRALAIVVLSLCFLLAVTLALTIVEPFPFLSLLFEATSAFGTVGLSTGITPYLSKAGRVLLIVLMYTGRLGPLTLTVAMAHRGKAVAVKHPEEKIIVG